MDYEGDNWNNRIQIVLTVTDVINDLSMNVEMYEEITIEKYKWYGGRYSDK